MVEERPFRHTPAPWRYDRIVTETPELAVPHLTSHVVVANNRASSTANEFELAEIHSRFAEADARLIAAAPDLLDSLEWALDVVTGYYDEIAPGGWRGADHKDSERWRNAMEALAKARGEAVSA
jgi:hypothetical protein